MKCVTKSLLNSLKVKTELGAILLNHTRAGPLSVVGKVLHMILSRIPYKLLEGFERLQVVERLFRPILFFH